MKTNNSSYGTTKSIVLDYLRHYRFFQNFIVRLLCLPAFYFNCFSFQLKDRALSVSTFEEFEVRSEALKAIDEKRQEVLEIIEDKKQDAIGVIEEKKEVDRLTTQYNQIKESLDNFMSSTSSDIQSLNSRQDDLVESLEGVKGVQQGVGRRLADLESLEKMRKLKYHVLKKRADFKADLVAFYRQNHGTLPLAPLVKEYDAPILDFYVKPSFKLADHMVEENSDQNKSIPFHSYRKIFFEETRQCKHIYITSPAGMGKTSFVNHLVMTWCHAHQPRKEDEKHFEEYRDDVELMKSFEFIFLLALRDAPEEDCEVDAMIQNQIMIDLTNSHCYDENFLKEILAKETCLIILDGLDEWSHPVTKTVACRCQKNKSIPRLIVRENCTVLTTTRPWKLTKAGISDASIDKHVEMTEMSVSSYDKLVDDVLSFMNARYNKNKQPKDFKDEILKTDLNKLERIPLVLMQLLCLWFDGKPVGSSRCAIFANMLELLFRRVESTDAEIMESDRTDVATGKTIPTCFIGNHHCMGKYVLLRSLGAMSFDALFSDKENPHLVFDNDITLNYLSKSELQFCLKAGILTQSRSRATVSARQSKTWFIHKTYQEFLAALYISTSTEMAEKLSKQLFTALNSLQDFIDMSFFFVFLYGLCPADICVGISEKIEFVVERTEEIQIHRTSLKSAYLHSSVGPRCMRLVYFLVECASERKDNNSHLGIIPLKDFFLLEDVRLMDTVNEIIKSKMYCIKSIFWVTQAFLDSIDVNNIHSVQNIALSADVNADSVRTIIIKLSCHVKRD
ncbi:uncharacterized protein LOC123561926 [Mercenaria mercenaria]|uniref:uncharacterized protein LOC123561926 n=1 Tax=Mercenaria mercenaria TaxID=6596 RepID=UPI00234F65B5|nr:uncharacterized protein LOC123561926 [Mercenaria mercenaria]